MYAGGSVNLYPEGDYWNMLRSAIGHMTTGSQYWLSENICSHMNHVEYHNIKRQANHIVFLGNRFINTGKNS